MSRWHLLWHLPLLLLSLHFVFAQDDNRPTFDSVRASRGMVPDNAGREFIIMFMENRADDPNPNLMLRLFITTKQSTHAVTGTVSTPWRNPQSPSVDQTRTFRVREGFVDQATYSPRLRLQKDELKMGYLPNRALKVVVDYNPQYPNDEVIVYGHNVDTYTGDGFLALPTSVLDREYYAVTYYPATYLSEIGIAIVEDDTDITFTFPASDANYIGNGAPTRKLELTYDGRNYTNGQTLTVRGLNHMGVFQLQSDADLTGTFIQANKKIAVFSGNVRTWIGVDTWPNYIGRYEKSRDHLVEQLFPIHKWGTNFVVFTADRDVGDYFKIVAGANNLRVSIFPPSEEAGSEIYLPNRGDSRQILLAARSGHSITCSSPCQIAKFVVSQKRPQANYTTDPTMILQIPINQWDYSYTVATPLYGGKTQQEEYKNLFEIIIREQHKNRLILNTQRFSELERFGQIQAEYRVVHHGTSYSVISIRLESTSAVDYHTIRTDDPTITFGAYLYGHADRESYGFPCGSRLAPINPCVITPQPYRTRSDGFRIALPDGLDNDCDGMIDEEVCNDGRDDDGDGKVDEDCAYIIQPPEPEKTTRKTTRFFIPVTTPTTPSTPPWFSQSTRQPAQQSTKAPIVIPPTEPFLDSFGRQFILMFLETGETVSNPELLISTTWTTQATNCRARSNQRYFGSQRLESSFTFNSARILSISPGHRHIVPGKEFKGIRLDCTPDVSVMARNGVTRSSDMFVVWPTDVLARNYIVTCPLIGNGAVCQFGVVADGDDTQVMITFPPTVREPIIFQGQRHMPNTPIIATLHDLDTIVVQSSQDLTGTKVTATRNVAVYTGTVASSDGTGGGPTHTMDSLVPVISWGRTFITLATPGIRNIIKITASEPDTKVEVYDRTLTTTRYDLLSPPQHQYVSGVAHLPPTSSPVRIVSNKPIQVLQSLSQDSASWEGSSQDGRSGHLNVIPVELYHNYYTANIPSEPPLSHYLTIISKPEDIAGIKINGEYIHKIHPINAVRVPGLPDYRAFTVQVQPGHYVLYHTDPASTFYGRYYGVGANGQQVYLTGLGGRAGRINQACSPTAMMAGDLVDNDCDGKIDEEICDGRDNDYDSVVDEDCGYRPWPEPETDQSCSKVGAEGNPGPKGFRGPPGKGGVEGPKGAAGLRGDNGSKGRAGVVGDPGFRGGRGPLGDKGPLGDRGAQGSTGVWGVKGFPGFHGEKGEKGYIGFRGDVGSGGGKGDKGIEGFTGPPGPGGGRGVIGVPGLKGEPGPPGRVEEKCPPGYKFSEIRRECIDIRECSNNNGGCQLECKEAEGSYSCHCPAGFVLASDAHSCVDIDECDPGGNKPCGGFMIMCLNTWGGYQCINQTELFGQICHFSATGDRPQTGEIGGSVGGSAGGSVGSSSASSSTALFSSSYSYSESVSSTDSDLVNSEVIIGLFVWLVILTLICLVALIFLCCWVCVRCCEDQNSQKDNQVFYLDGSNTMASHQAGYINAGYGDGTMNSDLRRLK